MRTLDETISKMKRNGYSLVSILDWVDAQIGYDKETSKRVVEIYNECE